MFKKQAVAELENSLKPAECRAKRVDIDILYWELYTEHGARIAEVTPKKLKISFEHKIGHPRWF